MSNNDTDRLLRESDIIRLIKERYGLSACGIIETIRDVPSYEDKEKHDGF